jgi:MarR family transcriptional regulator, 2-MHQ and catechol-resistance regulon repressor
MKDKDSALGSEALNPSALEALKVAETYTRLSSSADVRGMAALFSLARAFTLTNQLSDRFFGQYGRGVSTARYSLLRSLYLSDNKQRTLNDIARELGVTAQNITYLLTTLEKEGLVERIVSSVDRRIGHARLTPAGEALCDDVMPKALQFITELVAPFTEAEKLQLTALLGKMHSHLLQRLDAFDD